MAVVIRMKRQGAKKRPFYRVVVADSRSPRDGRYIEQLGYYDPLTNPATFKVDAEKFASWIRKGALPSESVGVMMSKLAPEAMRPAPLPKPEAAPARVKKAKAAKPKAAKPAAKKAAKTHKGVEKKAKARAKKKTGAAKPRAAKAAKKSKK